MWRIGIWNNKGVPLEHRKRKETLEREEQVQDRFRRALRDERSTLTFGMFCCCLTFYPSVRRLGFHEAVILSHYDNCVNSADHAFQSRFCLHSSCLADIALRMSSAQSRMRHIWNGSGKANSLCRGLLLNLAWKRFRLIRLYRRWRLSNIVRIV